MSKDSVSDQSNKKRKRSEMESEDETFNCTVCEEKYSSDGEKVPCILPCAHTFCKDCISKLQTEKEPKCPTCRASAKTSNPKQNFELARMIGILEKNERKDKKSKVDGDEKQVKKPKKKVVVLCTMDKEIFNDVEWDHDIVEWVNVKHEDWLKQLMVTVKPTDFEVLVFENEGVKNMILPGLNSSPFEKQANDKCKFWLCSEMGSSPSLGYASLLCRGEQGPVISSCVRYECGLTKTIQMVDGKWGLTKKNWDALVVETKLNNLTTVCLKIVDAVGTQEFQFYSCPIDPDFTQICSLLSKSCPSFYIMPALYS